MNYRYIRIKGTCVFAQFCADLDWTSSQMPHESRHSSASLCVHVAPPPTLSISSHLQSLNSEKHRLEQFSHGTTFNKFHSGAASATVIQRVWRSHISRLIQSDLQHLQRLVDLERSVLTVQRCWRGHLGRCEACALSSEYCHEHPAKPRLSSMMFFD